ncbi:hypothetical protein OSTOST_03671 [Ostertagia ostertagi]
MLNVARDIIDKEVCIDWPILKIADYTRRLENGYWQYSNLCVQLLSSYRNKFRDLFAFLEKSHTPDDAYLASDIWENEARRKERVSELKEFLCSVPTYGMEKQEGGKQYVDRLVIAHIENAIKEVPKKRWGFRKCAINPGVLYRVRQFVIWFIIVIIFEIMTCSRAVQAELYGGKCCADPDADFILLDRVVYTLQGTTIPFGSQGTVVGLSSGKVDVLFDHEFNSGYKIRGTRNSGACVAKTSLINITYGKSRKGRSTPTAEEVKKHREYRHNRVKKEKRLVAGKENFISVKQKSSLSGAHLSPLGIQQGQSISEQLQKIALMKANIATPPILNSGADPIATHPPPIESLAISKELVENQLASLLGIKTSKNERVATKNEDWKGMWETSSVLKLFAISSENTCNDKNVTVEPKLSGTGQPSAFTKLFPAGPQNHNENCTNAFSTLKVQQTPVSNAPFPADLGTLLMRRGNVPFRGNQRKRAPAMQVTLPCRKPRRRRGGKQLSTLTRADQQNQEGDVAANSGTNAIPPSRGFASSRAHRVRKSRLAPKFAESN